MAYPQGQYPNPTAYPYPQPGYPAGAPYNGGAMTSPLMQSMDSANLAAHDGIVMRQFTQWGEIAAQMVGLPIEQANKYKISPLPHGLRAATHPDDPKRWIPTGDQLQSLPFMMLAKEKSDCCTRTMLMCCGLLNHRPFTMNYTDTSGQEHFRLERPFKCGGVCCNPFMLTVKQGDRALGEVVEDCDDYCSKCCTACWTCVFYSRVMETRPDGVKQHLYTVRTNTACCGRVNNCFGATCCKDSAVFDILDPAGKEVGHIQKVYASDGLGACCRMAMNLNNYILDFPPQSSPAQRALLMGALVHINYQLFEKTGDNGNNN